MFVLSFLKLQVKDEHFKATSFYCFHVGIDEVTPGNNFSQNRSQIRNRKAKELEIKEIKG